MAVASLSKQEEIGNFYNEGNKYLRQAIAYDNQGAVTQALRCYTSAAAYMLKAINYETNEALKKKLDEKTGDILTRCETLKKHLQTAPNHQPGKQLIENQTEPDFTNHHTREPFLAPPSANTTRPLTDYGTMSKPPASDSSVTSPFSWFLQEKPHVSWDEVIGLTHVKNLIVESFELPRKFPSLYKGKRERWSGMLLFGPPGTGKTLIVKAMATELNATFINVKTADIVSKLLGDSEKQVKTLFHEARSRATVENPVIIFFDEIDSLCMDRSLSSGGGDSASSANMRLVTQFLTEMDGIDSQNTNLFIVGATNLPWLLDTGILRRFQKRLYISLPDFEARKQIIRLNLSKNRHMLTDKDFNEVAAKTAGYSGSDLATLSKEALFYPLKDIMNATEFFLNPDNGKYIPIVREEDKEVLLKEYESLCQQKYHHNGVVETRWQKLTNDMVDPDIPVTRFHLLESLLHVKAVTNMTIMSKYLEWTQEHAEEEMAHIEKD